MVARDREAASGPGRLRLFVGYTAVAGMVPYLVLKILWECGHTVGLDDASTLDDPTMRVLNLATLGMEAVAVVVAMALTYRWGARLPAWLVVFPIWVATGLLAPRVAIIPLAAVHGSAYSSHLIDAWVMNLVSTAFAVQGAALMAAFVLYCRARWGELLLGRVADRQPGVTHGFQIVAVRAGAVMAAVIAVLCGIGVVVAEADVRASMAIRGISDVVWMAAAVVGSFILVRPFGFRRSGVDHRYWVPVVLVFAGSGAMVWWGVWSLINALTDSVIAGEDTPPVAEIATLGGVCVGLLLAVVATFGLVERAARRGCA